MAIEPPRSQTVPPFPFMAVVEGDGSNVPHQRLFHGGQSRPTDPCTQLVKLFLSTDPLRPDPQPSGATDISRKTNYDFERREREKTKAAEAASKAQAKADKKAAGQEAHDADRSDGPTIG